MEQIKSPAYTSFKSNQIPKQYKSYEANQLKSNTSHKKGIKASEVLTFLSLAGTVAFVTAGILKCKNIKPPMLEDLTWINGKAFLKEKNDIPFSGAIVKNIDDSVKVATTFANGMVVKQQKNGKNGFVKIFKYNKDGKLSVMKFNKIKTKLEYDCEGKLLRKKVGKDVYDYGYTSSGKLDAIAKNNKMITLNIYEKKSPQNDKEILKQVCHLTDNGQIFHNVKQN